MYELVSIVIAAYNTEKYLKEAIDSCLSQSYGSIEIILVNDGSTDGTLAIMEEYRAIDSRISVVSQENKGVGAARNLGNSMAKGKLIAVLDADDIMYPNKLMEQMEYLKKYPEIDILSCWMEYINEEGKNIGAYIYPDDLTNPSQFKKYLEENKPVALAHSGVIYKKHKVEAVGGYRSIRPGQDTDLWYRMVENDCIAVVLPKILGKYRIYLGSDNTSVTLKSFYAYHWLKYNSSRRKQKLEEITFDEYMIEHRKKTWKERFRIDKPTYVLYYSRKFAIALGNKRYFRAFGILFIAILIDPVVILKKFTRKLRFHFRNLYVL